MLFGCRCQFVEVGESSIHRIDRLVVGNVIAEVYLWRRKARGDPDCIHTHVLQVIELRCNAVEIPDSVVVAIRKAAWINFVKNGMLPPLMPLRIDRFASILTGSLEGRDTQQ